MENYRQERSSFISIYTRAHTHAQHTNIHLLTRSRRSLYRSTPIRGSKYSTDKCSLPSDRQPWCEQQRER